MDQGLLERRGDVEEGPDVGAYWRAAKTGRATAYLYVNLLGIKDRDPIKIVKKVREGLAFESLERFQENTQFSTKDVADLVAIPARTLQRRKVQGRLDPYESDRLLRVARVFAKALELFEGDARAAHDWFHTPARALGGEEPIRLAATDLGAREVEALVERLEHGVLA